MRIKNMYFTCKKYFPTLTKLTHVGVKNYQERTDRKYNDYYLMKAALYSLDEIECLQEYTTELLRYDDNTSSFYVVYANITKFDTVLVNLCSRIQTIIELGDSLGLSIYENGIDIKLPDNLSFDEFSQCVSDLNKVFNQCPYFKVDGEKIAFDNVDLGSTWLAFATISTGASILLNNLACFVRKCFDIASDRQRINYQKEQIRSLKMKNDVADTMITGFETIEKELLNRATKELGKEVYTVEPEDEERVSFCLGLLSDWMEKGMEIYACLEAPDETQKLFPSRSEQTYLTHEKKMLPSEGSDEDA